MYTETPLDILSSSTQHVLLTAQRKHSAQLLVKHFGITVGAPSGIGIVLADTASKTATIDPISIATPGNGGTSFSNEVNFFFTGDSGAVRQAIIGAREVGKQLLKALEPNEPLESGTVPYI